MSPRAITQLFLTVGLLAFSRIERKRGKDVSQNSARYLSVAHGNIEALT